MKGSPFQRNFGVGSPAKQGLKKEGKSIKKKTDAERFEEQYGMTSEEFTKFHEEDSKKKLAEYNAKQAGKESNTPK